MHTCSKESMSRNGHGVAAASAHLAPGVCVGVDIDGGRLSSTQTKSKILRNTRSNANATMPAWESPTVRGAMERGRHGKYLSFWPFVTATGLKKLPLHCESVISI